MRLTAAHHGRRGLRPHKRPRPSDNEPRTPARGFFHYTRVAPKTSEAASKAKASRFGSRTRKSLRLRTGQTFLGHPEEPPQVYFMGVSLELPGTNFLALYCC